METGESRLHRSAVVLLAILALAVAAVFVFLSIPEPEARFERTGTALGTFVTVSVAAGDQQQAAELISAAFEEMGRLEKLLSRFNDDSEVSAINKAPPWEPVRVAAAVLEVIEQALEVSRLTDGAFDVTVGPLVELWTAAGRTKTLPSDEDLAAARGKVSFKKLYLDERARTVTRGAYGMSVDLGAIAKGFIAESAARLLRSRGVKSGLIDAGGDIVFIGESPQRRAWSVGVKDPREPAAIADTLYVRDRAVVTSGNYERFSVIEGRRYSHIIDPRTGRPVDGPDSVTVIAADAAAADAWATALSVTGKSGADAARAAGVEFLMYFVTDGRLERFESTGLDALRKEQ